MENVIFSNKYVLQRQYSVGHILAALHTLRLAPFGSLVYFKTGNRELLRTLYRFTKVIINVLFFEKSLASIFHTFLGRCIELVRIKVD